MTDSVLIPSTITTWQGTVIAATITTTPHSWVADSTGLFHTKTDLAKEWTSDYEAMLKGNAALLTPLQRLEGNAEATVDNTKLAHLSATKLTQYREDLQREFDAIYAAQLINQQQYGIDPTKELDTYTYLKLEQTMQSSPSLEELGVQGHGTNDPIASRYIGYTTGFQNVTDNKTYFVGGGLDNAETAVPNFTDDVNLGHTPFATVMRNGVLFQLNQNGNREDPLARSIVGQNESEYERIFVASDYSLDKTATGAQVFVDYNGKSIAPAPAPVAGPGQITTQDGSVISGTIVAGEHTWVADGTTGLLHTGTNLAAEWKADYAMMLAGKALTAEQRQEANAEAVLENTGIAKLSAPRQLMFREDLTRQFDAEAKAQLINQKTLGISPTAQFTTTSIIALSDTIFHNETLNELYTQGHGLNSKNILVKYRGYTDDFQNNIDNETNFSGAGPEAGTNALGSYVDNELLGHIGGPVVLNNGHIRVVQQNSNLSQRIDTVVTEANLSLFTLKTDASSFAPKPAPVPAK